MKFSPKILINSFLVAGNPKIKEEFASHLQFDFLYDRILSFQNISKAISKKEIRLTALLLSSYLAHWGMFRGSSSLKDTNIIFFEYLINELIGKKGVLLPIANCSFEDFEANNTEELKLAISDTKNLLDKNGISPTHTLVSKIIMGLLGNVPAYDTEFSKGLNKLKKQNIYQGVVSFGVNSIQSLSSFSGGYTWPSYKTFGNNDVPTGKLVDMAIFQYGRK